MSVFKVEGRGWVSKFQYRGKVQWTPGGPWQTKRQGQEAERRHRDRLQARRTEETCASFAKRWLEEWPRPAASTRRTYADAARRFADEFGGTPLGDVERLSAQSLGADGSQGDHPGDRNPLRGRPERRPGGDQSVLQASPTCHREAGEHHPADDGGVPGASGVHHRPRWLRAGVQDDDHLRSLDRDQGRESCSRSNGTTSTVR